MTESSTPEHSPGPAELSVLGVLDRRFEGVTVEQRGPDGSEVLAMLVFYVCPVCSAVVPTPDEEHPFISNHADWHIVQARALDVLNHFTRIGLGDVGHLLGGT